jgi:hypothetical protein
MYKAQLGPVHDVKLLLAVLALVSLGVSADDPQRCALPDPDFVYCPAIQAPRVTELRQGFAVLEYTVQTDGSVHDVRVVEAGGDRRWTKAATEWITQRRYRPSDHEVRKSERFDFNFADSRPIND